MESPWGTTSRLMYRNITDNIDDLDWTFTTNAFWGEEASGLWTLTIEDWFDIDTGVWNDYSVLAKTGYLVETVTTVPEPTTVALLGIGLAGLAGAEVRRRRKKKAVNKS